MRWLGELDFDERRCDVMNEVRQIEPMCSLDCFRRRSWSSCCGRRPDVVAEEKLNGERNLLHIQPDGSAVITLTPGE